LDPFIEPEIKVVGENALQINYQALKCTWKWNDVGLLHILNSKNALWNGIVISLGIPNSTIHLKYEIFPSCNQLPCPI